jgi:hypothetical protein
VCVCVCVCVCVRVCQRFRVRLCALCLELGTRSTYRAHRTSQQLIRNGTFSDLLFFGKHAYTQADFVTAVDWYSRALQIATAEQEVEVLDYLAYSQFKVGRIDEALRLSKRLLELQPTNSRVADNVAYYEVAVQSFEAPPPPTANFSQDNLLGHTEEEMHNFRALCQGHVLYEPPVPLFCEYRTYNDPRLLLKPARVEHLSLGHENLQVCVCVCGGGGVAVSGWVCEILRVPIVSVAPDPDHSCCAILPRLQSVRRCRPRADGTSSVPSPSMAASSLPRISASGLCVCVCVCVCLWCVYVCVCVCVLCESKLTSATCSASVS